MKRKLIVLSSLILIAALSITIITFLKDESSDNKNNAKMINSYSQYKFKELKNFEEPSMFQEQEYFKIYHDSLKFYYFIYDKNGNVVTEGGLRMEPHIEMLDDHTVCFWSQAGTGASTRWGYF